MTFQRDGCKHSGAYVSSRWANSDGSWKAHTADEFAKNMEQIVGLPTDKGTHRICFAQFLQGERMPGASIFASTYDDSAWSPVAVVKDGPWPARPLTSRVPRQHEEPISPVLLLAQGHSDERHIAANSPVQIEKSILHAELRPTGP